MTRSSTQMMRRALELLSRKANPPHRPGLRQVSLAELGCDAADLRHVPLGALSLRGIDFANAQMPLDELAFQGMHLDQCKIAPTQKALNHRLEECSSMCFFTQYATSTNPSDRGSHRNKSAHVFFSRGHGYVSCVIQLNDGRLCTTCPDGTIKLWDVGYRICIATLEGHKGSVRKVIQLSDGRICSASDDHTIKVWDTNKLKCSATLEGHTGWVRCVTQLSDGRICSAGNDHTIKVWDLNKLKCSTTLEGHTDCVKSVIQLHDGRICSASRDHTIKIWDTNNKLRHSTLKAPGVSEILQLNDGRICSASHRMISLWNPETLQCSSNIKVEYYSIDCLTELYDGRLCISGLGGKISLLDVNSDELTAAIQGQEPSVNSLVQLNDGRLCSAGTDGTIKLWNVVTGNCVGTLEGQERSVCSVIQLEDGRVCTYNDDGIILLWHPDSGHCTEKIIIGHPSRTNFNTICEITQLSDSRLCCADAGGDIKLWNIGNHQYTNNLKGHKHAVNDVIQLASGNICSASAGEIRIWNSNSGECVNLIKKNANKIINDEDLSMEVNCVIQLTNGQICSAGGDGMVEIWDPTSGVRNTAVEAHTSPVLRVTQLDNGLIYSTGEGQVGKLWDSELKQYTSDLDEDYDFGRFISQLDNGQLCFLNYDNTISLWDIENGQRIVTLKGHKSSVRQVVQLADGRLCSADHDGLRFWNLESGLCETWQVQLSDETVLRLDKNGACFDNLKRPWHTVTIDGQRQPCDQELGCHAGFLVDNRWPMQPWRFPDRLEWFSFPQWPGELRRVRLSPAPDQDLQAILGHIVRHDPN